MVSVMLFWEKKEIEEILEIIRMGVCERERERERARERERSEKRPRQKRASIQIISTGPFNANMRWIWDF
jgi:hypothetical protein